MNEKKPAYEKLEQLIEKLEEENAQLKTMESALKSRIESLTLPLEDCGNIVFEDLFSIDDIQRIQDEFADATGVASIITHTDGTPITKPSNFCRLCKDIIRNTDKGLLNCFKSDAVIGRFNPKGPNIQLCMSSGLWEAGAGITVGGRHIANWLIGQVRNEHQTENKMLAYAREVGADEKIVLDAFREVPSMSLDQLRKIADFLFTTANQLSATVYQTVQQARFISEIQRSEEALRKSENKYRTLVENAEEAIFVTQDGVIKFANQKILELSGQSMATLENKPFFDFIHSDDRTLVSEWHRRRIAGEDIPDHYSFRIIQRSGEMRWVELKSVLLEWQGRPAVLNFLSDITDRKLAEEERQQQHDLIDNIMTTSSVGFALGCGRNIVWANKAMEDLFGFTSKSQYVDHDTRVLYANDEEYKRIGKIIFEDTCKGRVTEIDAEFIRQDGSIFTGMLRINLLNPNDPAKGRIVNIVDITERKRAEDALRFEREQLLSIFDSIGEIIYVVDPDTHEILYINKTLMDALQKNVIGGICYREFQGFDSPCHFCTNDILRKQNDAPYYWEYHNPVLNRDYVITDRIIKWPDGRDVRFELAIDITERKRAEEALRESEKRFRRFSAAAFEAIIIHEGGILINANDQYFEMFGYEPGELMRKQALTLTLAPEAIESTMEEIARGGLGPYESIGCKKDGSKFPIEIRVREWEYEGRKVRVAAIMDISERKRIEEELENYRMHLEDLVKSRTAELEAKNKELETFTYSVSHDLKAPLRGIDGYSHLLEEEYSDKLDEEGLLFLKNIRRSAEQMNQLIEDLLTYSRMERRQLQPVSIELRPMIDMMISQRDRDIETGNISISVNLPFETVTSDKETLWQVLGNYLDNAIKFSKKDSTVTVEIGGQEDSDSWTLWVKDNGIGFDPKYHDRIFNIFQRLNRAEDFPGTGVGLAIVRKAVERIAGRVWAKSETGKGSTFFITIPK